MKKKREEKKNTSKWSGFFIAAWFLVVGIIFFYTPIYIGLSGFFAKTINLLGWVAIIISIAGAFLELSKIFKNDGFSYIGTSLVFLVPAVLLHILQEKSLTNQTVITIFKSGVIFLLVVGSALFLQGFAYFLENPTEKSGKTKVSSESKTKKTAIELMAPIIIAILSLTTAIIKFVSEVS